MPLNVFAAGSRITADELNSLGPTAAVRASTQSVTSSTTLVNDDTLFLPLDPDATYLIQACLYYTAATGGDYKYTFTAPSGATGTQAPIRQNLSGSFAGGFGFNWTATTTAQGSGGSTTMNVYAVGTMTTSNGGILQLQWAQNTSSATATVMQLNSSLTITQIA